MTKKRLKSSSKGKIEYTYFLIAKILNRDTTINRLILIIKSIPLQISFPRKRKITK
jgi:uncharacterized membrane protein